MQSHVLAVRTYIILGSENSPNLFRKGCLSAPNSSWIAATSAFTARLTFMFLICWQLEIAKLCELVEKTGETENCQTSLFRHKMHQFKVCAISANQQ